jgi:hypothetical protein
MLDHPTAPAAVVRLGVATLVFVGVVSALGGSTENALACLYAAGNVVIVATGEPFDGRRYLRRNVWLCAACAIVATILTLWVQAVLFAAVAGFLARMGRILAR